MADLTLIQRFGANIAFNETTKILSINLTDLTSIMVGGIDVGLNVAAMTTANKDQYASKILWALLLKSQATQAVDNNDETVKLYVTNQGKRNVTRNNVAQFGYQLVATAYQNDSLGVTLDPDNLA
jgi:hypothetical protein